MGSSKGQCVECGQAGAVQLREGWFCNACLKALGFSLWQGPAGLAKVEAKLAARRAAGAPAAATSTAPPQLDALAKLRFRKFISDQSGMSLEEADRYVEGLPEAERHELIRAFLAQPGGAAPSPSLSPAPAAQPAPAQPDAAVTQPQCPRCQSFQTTHQRQGFSAGKAIAGFLIAPGGVLWGFHGKNKIVITCMSCGHQWKAG